MAPRPASDCTADHGGCTSLVSCEADAEATRAADHTTDHSSPRQPPACRARRSWSMTRASCSSSRKPTIRRWRPPSEMTSSLARSRSSTPLAHQQVREAVDLSEHRPAVPSAVEVTASVGSCAPHLTAGLRESGSAQGSHQAELVRALGAELEVVERPEHQPAAGDRSHPQHRLAQVGNPALALLHRRAQQGTDVVGPSTQTRGVDRGTRQSELRRLTARVDLGARHDATAAHVDVRHAWRVAPPGHDHLRSRGSRKPDAASAHARRGGQHCTETRAQDRDPVGLLRCEWTAVQDHRRAVRTPGASPQPPPQLGEAVGDGRRDDIVEQREFDVGCRRPQGGGGRGDVAWAVQP